MEADVVSQDGQGWVELYDLVPPATVHPEQDAQRREFARKDAARRARLADWEAALPGAEAAVAATEAAIATVEVRLAQAGIAYERRYRQVTGGRAIRDTTFRLPIVWWDDARCEPELGRRRLLEQELAVARAERTRATGWRDWLVVELAWIKGTTPAKAP